MYIQQFFRRHLKPHIPLKLYPILALPYRWFARRAVKKMTRQDEAFRQANVEVVAPPALLRFKVVGECTISGFLEGGASSLSDLERGLCMAGASFDSGGRVLDFGCGCGRSVLAFRRRWPSSELYGVDVDAEAIEWCRSHIQGVSFHANAPLPPLPYPDAFFDTIYTISVFTHLDESRQFAWLTELRRLIKPNGFLLATVHGQNFWGNLPKSAVERIRSEGFLFTNTDADRGLHPDWYQVAWHTEEYIKTRWSDYFEVCAHLPQGLSNYQDIVVLRRRDNDR